MKAKQSHLLSRLHCKDLMALKTLLSFDPTPKKIYRNWLIDCFNKKLIRLEDQAMVFKDLETFEQLKLTQSLDIQNMSFREFRKITSVEPDLSNNQKEKQLIRTLENSGDIEVLLRNKTTTIKVPHTHQAACILGRGTKWCTASKDNPSIFEDYNDDGNLYVITHNGAKIQAHIESEQFMDELDIELNDDALKTTLELLEPFINESAYGYLYARHILEASFPLAERAIAQSSQYAYQYARDALKAPFPQAEQVITKDPRYAYLYAHDILKSPFPQGEKIISKDPEYAYHYASHILKAPFPKGEKAIAQSPQYAHRYAHHVLNTPFPLGEKAIAKDPKYACLYASHILKAPFPQAELTIAKDPEYAYYYASDILKAPFPQAEKIISKKPYCARLYKEFLKTLT